MLECAPFFVWSVFPVSVFRYLDSRGCSLAHSSAERFSLLALIDRLRNLE